MPLRVPQPGQSLADKFPTVAATWHPTANDLHTPGTISSKVALVARWRCPAGHEWDEQVSTRTNKPAWKRGDVAACRLCVGHHVIVEFACGHTATCDLRAASRDKCPDCHEVDAAAARATWARGQAERQREYSERRALAGKVYDECEPQARAAIEAIGLPADVPEPLATAWRSDGLRKLRAAIAAEAAHGKTGAAGQVLAEMRRAACALLPDTERLTAAAAACEPVVLVDKAHWPAGWIWHQSRAAGAQPATPAQDHALVASLRTWLSTRLTDHPHSPALAQFSVADMTWWLTERIFDWAKFIDQIFPEYPVTGTWRTRRELSVPVVPDARSGFGRVDVIVMRSDAADVVIELDSEHNEASVTKLEFARDAGAVPVWIRWHAGRVHQLDGVAMIDLVDATWHLAAGGQTT